MILLSKIQQDSFSSLNANVKVVFKRHISHLDDNNNKVEVETDANFLDKIIQKECIASVAITIYSCHKIDYPRIIMKMIDDGKFSDQNRLHDGYPKSNWLFHGIIISGSYSGAYEEDYWIKVLKSVIQRFIHKNNIPTLGVCFGHQIYAHSFSMDENDNDGGKATPCPIGTQAGTRFFTTTPTGQYFFSSDRGSSENGLNGINREIQLLYTHGDMVHSLPSCASSLGGNSIVPIQSACYFSSNEQKECFQTIHNKQNDTENNSHSPEIVKPYAFTFQAHPEYALDFPDCIRRNYEKESLSSSHLNSQQADDGFHPQDTFHRLLNLLFNMRKLSSSSDLTVHTAIKEKEEQDVQRLLGLIQEDSINVIASVAKHLNWIGGSS